MLDHDAVIMEPDADVGDHTLEPVRFGRSETGIIDPELDQFSAAAHCGQSRALLRSPLGSSTIVHSPRFSLAKPDLASHPVPPKPRAEADASADWKQAVSSATASGRKICQNHFFKNQISLALMQREYPLFEKLWDICDKYL